MDVLNCVLTVYGCAQLARTESRETGDFLVYDNGGVELAFSCIEKSLPAITSEVRKTPLVSRNARLLMEIEVLCLL